MDLKNIEFKRTFATTLYRRLSIKLAEMCFEKNFVTESKRGNPYPLTECSEDCLEEIAFNRYTLLNGWAKRFWCRFFPYASYKLSAEPNDGSVGFVFNLPKAEASLLLTDTELIYACGEKKSVHALPDWKKNDAAMTVCCRPGAFDVCFENNGKAEFFLTLKESSFADSHCYAAFCEGGVSLFASKGAQVQYASAFIDNGISIADMRPIRFENGEIMIEGGKVFLTASIRMQSGSMQGVFSWIPGTAEIDLSGALFFDTGDGRWCRDVASSILYHRAEKRWLLWVCSFSHGHVLAHAAFDGDPRFGVNVIDVELMPSAQDGHSFCDFVGFEGDEDPDFFFDEERGLWRMAICRVDSKTKKYRYAFFESHHPFSDYHYVGRGRDGAETGGSFVKLDGETFFLCGNDFSKTSDYRIYSQSGMTTAKFNLPDGGFRGWGTLMPIRMGSRKRLFWMTFDRHCGSDYNWSYGNLYCFEAP